MDISKWLFFLLILGLSFLVRGSKLIQKIWFKFRKWFIVFLGTILIVAILIANSLGSLRIFYRRAFNDVLIYGATPEERILILETFHNLPQQYKDATTSIEVTSHLPAFIFSTKNNEAYEDRGTRGITLGSRIFIKPGELTKDIIEHEAIHVFHNTLDNSFNYAWDAFTLKMPADGNQTVFRPKGFLSDIGLDSAAEDVADFGKECLNYLADKNNYKGSLLLTNHHLRGGYDSIFKLKIHLMYRYGFFDNIEYNQLIEFVEKIK